ncbi:MAG: DUF2442 domain-containing protein [Pirellulales bacterium]
MQQSEVNRIVAARVIADHALELQFSDGFIGTLDFSPALWGPIFAPLIEPNNFRDFRLEDDTVRWRNGADFCPDVLRYWCETGSVQSQHDTDAHFCHQPASPEVLA